QGAAQIGPECEQSSRRRDESHRLTEQGLSVTRTDEPASRLILGCPLAHESPIGLSAGPRRRLTRLLRLIAQYHDRTVSIGHAVLGHRAEEQSRKLAVTPTTHHEQVRSIGCLHQM